MSIIVSVDIETLGSQYKNPVVAVGFVVGDDVGNVINTRMYKLKANWLPISQGGEMEDRCHIEFWSKHPDLVEFYKTDAVEQKEGWNAIRYFLDNLEQIHEGKKISFVTDNASFDIARIDYNLEKYCDCLPMRYSLTGQYRSIYPADDMLFMLPTKYVVDSLEHIKLKISDHNCVNDALTIYYQYIYAIKYKSEHP